MCVEISFELVRDPLRRGCCLETLLPLLWSHGLKWGLCQRRGSTASLWKEGHLVRVWPWRFPG